MTENTATAPAVTPSKAAAAAPEGSPKTDMPDRNVSEALDLIDAEIVEDEAADTKMNTSLDGSYVVFVERCSVPV